MTFARYRCPWNVPGGGVGVSTFNFGASASHSYASSTAAIRAFFDAMKSNLPNDVTISFASEVTEHSSVTGELSGAFAVTPPASVAGTVVSGWGGGLGVKYNWGTNQVVNGRRFIGHTYIVPTGSGIFDVDGTLGAASVTAFNSYGASLISALSAAATELVVWSETHKVLHPVVTGTVTDKSAIMRSRRDG